MAAFIAKIYIDTDGVEFREWADNPEHSPKFAITMVAQWLQSMQPKGVRLDELTEVGAVFQLVEIVPGDPDKDRLVEQFDRRCDAETVLKALEQVNINFNVYRIKTVDIKGRTFNEFKEKSIG